MKLTKYLIGVLIFTLFFGVGTSIWTSTIEDYNLDTSQDDKFQGAYDMVNDTFGIAQDMSDKSLEGDLEGGDESWESMAKGGYSSLRLFTGSYKIVGNVSRVMAQEVGVPLIFIDVLMIILMISIVFAIIFIVFRVKD